MHRGLFDELESYRVLKLLTRRIGGFVSRTGIWHYDMDGAKADIKMQQLENTDLYKLTVSRQRDGLEFTVLLKPSEVAVLQKETVDAFYHGVQRLDADRDWLLKSTIGFSSVCNVYYARAPRLHNTLLRHHYTAMQVDRDDA